MYLHLIVLVVSTLHVAFILYTHLVRLNSINFNLPLINQYLETLFNTTHSNIWLYLLNIFTILSSPHVKWISNSYEIKLWDWYITVLHYYLHWEISLDRSFGLIPFKTWTFFQNLDCFSRSAQSSNSEISSKSPVSPNYNLNKVYAPPVVC